MINIDGKLKLVDIIRQYDIRVGAFDSYAAFHILKTDRGTKILRVWEDVNKLQEIHRYKELLVTEGFRRIERFIPTKEGKPYVLHNSLVYTLSDLIEGLTANVNREMDMQIVGSTLGEFHLLSSNIIVDKPYQNWSNHFERGLQSLEIAVDKLDKTKRKSELDNQILENISIINKQISQSIQMAKNAERVSVRNQSKPILCHGHLSDQSFKIDEYGEGWMTDITTPVIDMAAYDLGKLIMRLYLKSRFNISPVNTLLDYYQDTHQLQKEDKLYILTYIAYPHEIWKFIYAYLTGRIAKNSDLTKEFDELFSIQINYGKLYQELFKYFNL